MKYLLLILLAVGCSRVEYGPPLTEPAAVKDTCFVPAGHGMTSGGMGMGFDGKMHYSFPQSVDIPAVYAVVFECQHGTFAIDGERGQDLYHRLAKGDHVTIHYVQKYSVSKSATNCIGLHFVSAEKVER